ncbi:uncharacterized protein LOC127631817 [Xyrauchen texanus]|uniref:uncharacterized protein LOC127631817 n=1 Tax=Xyrauchen texanus TaxID=154827 RepID=UPI0022426BA2|nr:uncharacterized protein LOC127631817 [Xyrauchen texanus]
MRAFVSTLLLATPPDDEHVRTCYEIGRRRRGLSERFTRVKATCCHHRRAANPNPGITTTTDFRTKYLKAVYGMARPEMESRVGDRNPGAPQSCRMEVLCQDAWQSGSTFQPHHRHRTIATQTSTVSVPLPHIPTQDAFISASVQQQDNPLRENTGTEQELRERQQHLPDQQSDNQSSSEDSMSSSGDDNLRLEEQAVERVATQLRTIGDEMNAVLLQRNAAPRWQNWRGLYRGLVAFVADTINAFYQHGLR